MLHARARVVLLCMSLHRRSSQSMAMTTTSAVVLPTTTTVACSSRQVLSQFRFELQNKSPAEWDVFQSKSNQTGKKFEKTTNNTSLRHRWKRAKLPGLVSQLSWQVQHQKPHNCYFNKKKSIFSWVELKTICWTQIIIESVRGRTWKALVPFHA